MSSEEEVTSMGAEFFITNADRAAGKQSENANDHLPFCPRKRSHEPTLLL